MKHAPVLVLDVDKDFEHDTDLQGGLMAQVGTAEVVSHCRARGQSRGDPEPPPHPPFFHGKNNFHTLCPSWSRSQLSAVPSRCRCGAALSIVLSSQVEAFVAALRAEALPSQPDPL